MQVRDRRRVSSALLCVTLERSEVTSGLNVSNVTQVSVSLKKIAFAWSVLNKRKVRSDKSSFVWVPPHPSLQMTSSTDSP